MMKELWIHGGLTKTGTSALQVFFAQNRDNLLREGIDYIPIGNIQRASSGKITSGNGQHIAQSLIEEGPFKIEGKHSHYARLFEYLKKKKNQKFLISSEFFQFVPLRAFEQLKEELNAIGITPHLVYYVRRQDQKLMAMYMQGVKRGGLTELPDEHYVKRRMSKDYSLQFFDYTRKCEGVFGEGFVHPFIYESSMQHEKGLAGHFTEAVLGIDPSWVVPVQRVNTSPSPFEVRFLLLANKYSPRIAFSDDLIENSIIAKRTYSPGRYQVFSADLLRYINERYSEQNTLFEKKYGRGDTFPVFEVSEHEVLSRTEFKDNIEETVDILAGILVAYDKRLSKLERNARRKKSLRKYMTRKLSTVWRRLAKLISSEKKKPEISQNSHSG